MIKLFGGRIASALVGISVLAMGSSASAQHNPTLYPKLDISAAVKALEGVVGKRLTYRRPGERPEA